MATPPRGKGNQGQNTPHSTSRVGSKAKKPTTIDLEASEIKDTSAAAKPATTKTVPTTSRPAAPKAQGPATSSDTKSKPTGASATRATPKPSVSTRAGASAKPKSADREAPKPAGTGGFGKLAAAGIIGGVITLGGAGAMQYSGLLPNLGQMPAPAPVVDLTPLQAKIEALQSRLGIVETSNSRVDSPVVDLKPLENRIAKLESKPVLPALFGNSDAAKPIDVEKLQTAMGKFEASNDALNKRLAALENTGSPQPDQSAISAVINSAIAPLSSASKIADAKIKQIETSVATLTRKIDEDVEARINAFDIKLKNAATGEKLAKSVAINALKSAMENGQPFSAALTSLETLAGPSNPLEKLKPFASNGIATSKQLLAEFHELQGTLLRAATNDPDAGLSDRLMSSIQSLVTISSNEALPGNSPEAVISRIDINLKSENFDAAVSEWKTLPDPAQQISKVWINKLEQRIVADRQMIKLMKSLQSDS